MLSHFSRVQLFVTQWAVATQLLCPWGSPGRSTRVGLCPPPGGLPNPGTEPHISYISGTGRCILYHLHHRGSPLITQTGKQKENGSGVIIVSDRTFCFSCNFSPFLVMLFQMFYKLSIIFHKKLHLIFRMLFYKEYFDKLNARLMTKILGNIY